MLSVRRVVMTIQLGAVALLITPMGANGAIAADDKPSPLIEELARCLDIRGDAERLACTDVAARRLVDATRKREVVVANKEEIRASRRSLFGFTLPNIGLFKSDEKEEVKTIEAKIASVGQTGFGKLRLTLEDGAVWTTDDAWGGRLPTAGTMVTIQKASLGSYFVRTKGGRSVRATRAR